MDLMNSITDILSKFGVTDQALNVMGPTLTILMAWVGGLAMAQLLKFPLALLVKSDDLHSYLTRLSGVMTAFSFAHFLSNHLSVPLEMLVGATQPLVYMLLLKAAIRWAPWLANTLLLTVDQNERNKAAKDPPP